MFNCIFVSNERDLEAHAPAIRRLLSTIPNPTFFIDIPFVRAYMRVYGDAAPSTVPHKAIVTLIFDGDDL
jgi:hypothetical protein